MHTSMSAARQSARLRPTTRSFSVFTRCVTTPTTSCPPQAASRRTLRRLAEAKDPNTFDCEFGYSCMGYEIGGAVGAKMALPDRDVVSWVGNGSYLMMNSDIYASVLTGHKVIFIVCDNEGFAVINRLQVAQGGEEFNNLLKDHQAHQPGEDGLRRHARHGSERGEDQVFGRDPRRLRPGKASDKTYVMVIDVAQYDWVGGGTWWEVGVPEVSGRAEVRAARASYEAESKHQRPGVAVALYPEFDGKVLVATGGAHR